MTCTGKTLCFAVNNTNVECKQTSEVAAIRVVVSRPRPDRERILDVVQEGRSSKLGVSRRAGLMVPTCNNSNHLAYMSLLKISRNTGAKETKERGLWKPDFDPLRSRSRLVKDGDETNKISAHLGNSVCSASGTRTGRIHGKGYVE